MEDKIAFVFMLLFAFIGMLIGYQLGHDDVQSAIIACEKELPRNINCKVIAVPVYKN